MIRVNPYRPTLPIRGGGGIGYVDARKKGDGATALAKVVLSLKAAKDRRLLNQITQQQAGGRDLEDVLSSMPQEKTGLGGFFDRLNPISPSRTVTPEMLEYLRGDELQRLKLKLAKAKLGEQEQPGISMEEALSQTPEGFEPSISIGPKGRVKGTSYKPKKAQYPENYKADLQSAIDVLSRGADAYKVYRRIAAKYPKQSAELKRILLFTPASRRLEMMRQALFGGG